MKEQQLVTVLINLEKLASDTEANLSKLVEYLENHYYTFETLIVSNGLCEIDNARIITHIKSLANVRVLRLVSKVNFDTAVAAGLENSIGDYVVLLDINYDPIEVIKPMVDINEINGGFVVGVQEQSNVLVKTIAKTLLENYPENATTLRCLSRHTINTLLKAGRYHHNILYRLHKIGINFEKMIYQRICDSCLDQSLTFYLRNAIFGNTSILRKTYVYSIAVSLLFILFSFLLLIIGADESIFDKAILLMQSFLYFSLIASLGFLVELLLRLVDVLSENERYIIAEEIISPIFIEDERFNIINA